MSNNITGVYMSEGSRKWAHNLDDRMERWLLKSGKKTRKNKKIRDMSSAEFAVFAHGLTRDELTVLRGEIATSLSDMKNEFSNYKFVKFFDLAPSERGLHHEIKASGVRIAIAQTRLTKLNAEIKKVNIAKSESRQRTLVTALRAYVGEDAFLAIVKEVDRERE